MEEGGRGWGGNQTHFPEAKKVACNLHPHGDDLGESVGLLVKIRCDDLAIHERYKCKM